MQKIKPKTRSLKKQVDEDDGWANYPEVEGEVTQVGTVKGF